MVTGPDGIKRLLVSEIVEKEIRDDPEKYYAESWSDPIASILLMALTTIICIGIMYLFLPANDNIWFTLAFLGNLTWATIATLYIKMKSVKHYRELHPEKYDSTHI